MMAINLIFPFGFPTAVPHLGHILAFLGSSVLQDGHCIFLPSFLIIIVCLLNKFHKQILFVSINGADFSAPPY
jgi:hypothetical protein